nr:hypothetical protein GCM10025732_38210 [Glycomyces mayteni]
MDACDVVIVDPGVVIGDTADNAPDTTTDYDQLGEDDTEVGTDATSAEPDPGEIAPEADPVRDAAVAGADTAIGQVRAALPDSWRLIVAGISDASAPGSLHPVLYSGPGVEPGDLTSRTTGRDGYVQLTDLTATALAVVGADIPATVAGAPVTVLADPGRTAAEAVDRGADLTAASAANADVSPNFYWTLSFVGVAVMLLAAHLVAGPDRFRRTARTVCIAFSAVPVAGVAAGIPVVARRPPQARVLGPHHRRGRRPHTRRVPALDPQRHPARTRRRRDRRGLDRRRPGLRRHLAPAHPHGLHRPGRRPVHGPGNYAFSVFAAAVILLVCFIPWRGRTRVWGPIALGVCAVVIVGAPMLGRDMGGTLTLVAAGILCCLKLWGKRLSIGAVLAAGGIAVAVFAVGGILDYLRPEEDQTHLGRFVGSVLDGTATQILIRKASAAWGTVGESMTWITLAALVAAVLIWRKRAPVRTDAVAAAVVGLTAVALIGGLVNDSGMSVPGFTAALGFGLLAVAVGPRHDTPAAPATEPAASAPAAT